MGLLSQDQQTIAAATTAAAVAAVVCCHGVSVAVSSRKTGGGDQQVGALPGGERLPQPCAPHEPKYAWLLPTPLNFPSFCIRILCCF